MSTQQHERDAMICRACGNEERASEGYPCNDCGTFICVICNMKGIAVRTCAAAASAAGAAPNVPPSPPS
jgi:hypothetical protein